MSVYDVMREQLDTNEKAYLVTALSGNQKGEKVVYNEKGEVLFGEPFVDFTLEENHIHEVLTIGDVEYFVQPVEKNPAVLVLGAGHVSRAIADLLLFIGCEVTVVDDRPEYLKPEFFDDRVIRVCTAFETLKETMPLNGYTGFIIVTRAHEFDNICLNQLRDQMHVYKGIMGSSKRIHYALEALRVEGWSEDELSTIYGPIGLDIGCQTPEEIALSIVSEYLAVMRGKKGGFLSAKKPAL